jgi:hypothetical protein
MQLAPAQVSLTYFLRSSGRTRRSGSPNMVRNKIHHACLQGIFARPLTLIEKVGVRRIMTTCSELMWLSVSC